MTTPGPSTSAPDPDPNHRRRLRPSGGYRQLRSYQVATVIYDARASLEELLTERMQLA